MDKELYFGVDVSKKTLDLAYYDGETIDWKNAHIKVSNDDAGFKKIGSWVAKVGKDFDTFLFCMEYTGLYNQNFRLWLESKEYIYGMVEPRKMHRFEPDLDDDQRSLDRIKTDELDAFRIAIYCEQNHKKILRNPSKLPSPVYFKLKRLLAERKQNTKQSVLYKQQLHDICAYDTDLSVERKKLLLKNMQENQKAIDKEIDSYMNEDTSIRKNYNLLTSIPGIGRIIALETIVLTENFTAINNPRKYACYIGIAPFKKESGTSVRKKTGVSKKGFSEAKADLSIAVLSAIKNNPSIRDYWIHKRKKKSGGIVLNAIKFKLVLRMFAVIKRGTPYVETDAYKN
jgi:transposase